MTYLRFARWLVVFGLSFVPLVLAGACGGEDKQARFDDAAGNAGLDASGAPGGGTDSISDGGGVSDGGIVSSGGEAGSSVGGPAMCDAQGMCADPNLRCDPRSGTCVGCLFDTDCPNGSCLNRICIDNVSCSDSRECVKAGNGRQTCDPATQQCVQCVTQADCPANSDCTNSRCVRYVACQDSLDCPSALVCNPSSKRCVGCVGDGDCGKGQRCAAGQCLVGCVSDKTCTPLGMLCDAANGYCVECLNHRSCPELYYCDQGKCALDVCEVGTSRCASSSSVKQCVEPGNGYTTTSCGAKQTCVEQGKTAACVDWVCNAGTVQCDPLGHSLVTCSSDGLSVTSSVDCAAQGQLCADDKCQSLACVPATRYCDNNTVRQCSADGLSSSLYKTCSAGQYCDPADQTCKTGICAPNQPVCNGQLATTCNANGSGYTGAAVDCSAQAGKICVNGACLCAPNQADCDQMPGNGCEVNLTSSVSDCGGCGTTCSSNHVTASCVSSTCNGACAAGFDDCNHNKQADGCEVDLKSDEDNCGTCGASCSSNHVARNCASGACNGACAAGFDDCNHDKQLDGCEADLKSDEGNCGVCGTTCSSNHITANCASGACTGACAAGFDDCNKNKQTDGCEISLLTDKTNCGACGNACPNGQGCSNGTCSALYTFSGIAQNLPIANLVGWTQCYLGLYSGTATLSSIQAACDQANLLMACRQTGSSTLTLAAEAPRTDVFFDVGTGATAVHAANGTNWYYNGNMSWGFAPLAATVNRNSCDFGNDATYGPSRMCWHTSASSITSGYRCGNNDLNGSTAWERIIFEAP